MLRLCGVLASALVLVAALATSGCTPARIEATGYEGSETRDVGPVTSVEVKAPADVTLIQGEGSSVRVTADRAALPYVTTRVDDGVLTISVEQGGYPIPVDKDVKIAVEVRSPTFLTVKNSERGTVTSELIDVDSFQIGNYGPGTVKIDRLRTIRLAADLGGSGDVSVGGGAAGAQQITVSGSGSYVAPDLESQVAVVTINGSGDAEIWATEALDATVSGTGAVSYWGEPELSAEASGSNKVTSLGWKAPE